MSKSRLRFDAPRASRGARDRAAVPEQSVRLEGPRGTDVDHRRSPRLEVLSLMRGDSEHGHTVTILNVAEGGLLVQTSGPLTKGDVCSFRFRLGDQSPTAYVFEARVVHVGADDELGDIAGLAFVPPRTEQQREATLVIRRACGDIVS